jgi:hypothetical protein
VFCSTPCVFFMVPFAGYSEKVLPKSILDMWAGSSAAAASACILATKSRNMAIR